MGLNKTAASSDDFQRYCLFDANYRMDWDEALLEPFFWKHYTSGADGRRVDSNTSWDFLDPWTNRPSGEPLPETPDRDDLLGRVLFYKVGHHGGHNATIQAKGLERMATKSGRLKGRKKGYVFTIQKWKW